MQNNNCKLTQILPVKKANLDLTKLSHHRRKFMKKEMEIPVASQKNQQQKEIQNQHKILKYGIANGLLNPFQILHQNQIQMRSFIQNLNQGPNQKVQKNY